MGFLLRNWHLKLSAVLLATVLYTGLVFSGSFSEAEIQVRVQQENAASDVYVLSGDLGLVEVRYRTGTDRAAAVVADSFVATVDLAEYDMESAPQPQELPIVVQASDGIDVLSVEPATIRVQLDQVEVRTIPVEVDVGTVPEGLRAADPVVSAEKVEVRGPASVVGQVDRAMAYLTIPSSGIDVNEPVDLVPVDVTGQPVGRGLIEASPRSVTVTIDVEPVETTDALTVRPIVEGNPGPGFLLESIQVEPATVTLRGLPEVLEGITSVATEGVSIAGATVDVTVEAELVIPDGTRLVEGDESVVTVTLTIVPSVASRTFVLGVVCQGAGTNACLPGLDQVAVTLSGPWEVLSGLSAAELTPVVSAAGLAPGSYTLAPSLAGLPDGVDLVSISPGAVPVTIVAPAAPTPEPTPVPTPAP
jgi:YbbR domain-containing protein